jgi:hypothetical protein
MMSSLASLVVRPRRAVTVVIGRAAHPRRRSGSMTGQVLSRRAAVGVYRRGGFEKGAR